MRRSILVALFGLAIAVGGALLWTGDARRAGAARGETDGGTEVALAHAAPLAAVDAGPVDDLPLPSLDAAGALVLDDEINLGIALPARAPKSVRLGVILVQYRGAQHADPTSRSKEEAFSMARSIADLAKVDFKSQLAKGDSGSMEDAGRFPRGVLEPAAEFTVFTLNPGDVSDPIDTPRGFWIVRRIE